MGSTLNKVVEISARPAFGLQVRFADGAAGVHDASDILHASGAMAIPLHDPAFFAKVTLDHGAPTWPNGYDMCPDWLRMEMEKAGEIASAAAE